MSNSQWQTFWSALGALAAIAAIGLTIYLTRDERSEGPQSQSQPVVGDVIADPPLSDPYAISRLEQSVAAAAEQARQAQTEGRAGAARARQASERAQEAQRRATAGGDERFQVVARDPEWRGERLASGGVVFGVLSQRRGGSMSGEFRFEERVETASDGVAAKRARFLPLRHIISFEQGHFEGTGTGHDGLWIGPGRFVFANGDVFEGVWRPGENTHGVLTYANGHRYEGEFEDLQQAGFDLQRHGLGVLWDASGSVSRQGRWVHGSYRE